uniref:Peptidase S54 rhomboid domain-containing protein n=1 Tax=Oryza punctata TaxID=4537 RepID=A0A0E0JZ92_ORYPU
MEVNHLGALRCYFSKLNNEDAQKPYSLHQKNKQKTGPLSTNIEEANMATDYGDFRNTLESFEINFNRRKKGTKGYLNTALEDYTNYLIFDEKNFQDMQQDDQTSSFCLTNLLAAINIAVLLFEIASPVRNSDIENLSLPLMYGAKINDLILSGEWWRLLTPMCLHSGFLHISLGCWVLLIFGPRDIYTLKLMLLNYRTHLGATSCGLLFGYLTCPSVQLDNAAKKGQKEAVVWHGREIWNVT